MTDLIAREVEALMPEMWTIAETLHAHPELSGEEHEAARLLTATLERHGFEVQRGVGGLPTAFVARSGPVRRPAVGFIAEYDALPDIGHGCGHNLIAASALCAAIALQRAASDMAGRVVVIGTPAEEVAEFQAKQRMLDAGAFAELDVVFANHGGERTTVGARSLAMDSLEFVFSGTPSHAAKYPHLGRSALDGALLTITGAEYLREHVRPDVRIHGIVAEGGVRANIVPERARLEYTVRANDRAYLDEVRARLVDCARAGALASGTEVEVRITGSNDDRLELPSLYDVLLERAVAAGAEQVMEPETGLGSTDFGVVSRALPASTLKVAFVDHLTPGHSRAWTEAAGGPRGRKAIEIMGRALAETGYRVLTDDGYRASVVAEFERLTNRST